MSGLYLVAAIASETTGTLSLKLASDGKGLRWYGLVMAGYLGAFALLTLALKEGLAQGEGRRHLGDDGASESRPGAHAVARRPRALLPRTEHGPACGSTRAAHAPPRGRAEHVPDRHARFSALSSRRQTMEPKASAGTIMSSALGPHHSGSKSR